MQDSEHDLDAIQKKLLVTVDEAALLLSLSPQTIRNGISVNTKHPFPIQPRRIGRAVRFSIFDIMNFIKGAK